MRKHVTTFNDFMLKEQVEGLEGQDLDYKLNSTDLDVTELPEEKEPKKKVDLADKRQISIAKDTVRNPKKGMFLGGPSVEQAEKVLKKFGYSDEQIEKLKGN